MAFFNGSSVASNLGFRMMKWGYIVFDLFQYPTRTLEKWPIRKGKTVVDFACGPGRYTRYLARKVGAEGKVYALDIHPLAIKAIEKIIKKNRLKNVDAKCCPEFKTGLHESSVDLIVFLDALHQIKKHDQLFKELHRILKPKGRLFLEPGHIQFAKAKEIVLKTGLFDIEIIWDHEHEMMLIANKKPPLFIHPNKKSRKPMRCLCIT